MCTIAFIVTKKTHMKKTYESDCNNNVLIPIYVLWNKICRYILKRRQLLQIATKSAGQNDKL